jgi:hypothetical protein
VKSLVLCLPVCLLGFPLAVYLLLAEQPSEAREQASGAEEGKAAEVKGEKTPPDPLPDNDPVAFLEKCVERYRREVQGYSLTLQKQERLKGKLYPKEIIEVHFKEKPHSVYMRWLQNPRKAAAVVYVEGQNNGKMLVHPAGIAGRFIKVVERDVEGPEAKESGRYPLSQFGIKHGMLRTLAGWKAAREEGKLKVEYLGVHQVKEVGDRPCYKLRRTYEEPEKDGVTELTIYLDKENWLQVGSQLKGEGGRLIAEYFFRDIRLNPEFKKDQFERSALTP